MTVWVVFKWVDGSYQLDSIKDCSPKAQERIKELAKENLFRNCYSMKWSVD